MHMPCIEHLNIWYGNRYEQIFTFDFMPTGVLYKLKNLLTELVRIFQNVT